MSVGDKFFVLTIDRLDACYPTPDEKGYTFDSFFSAFLAGLKALYNPKVSVLIQEMQVAGYYHAGEDGPMTDYDWLRQWVLRDATGCECGVCDGV